MLRLRGAVILLGILSAVLVVNAGSANKHHYDRLKDTGYAGIQEDILQVKPAHKKQQEHEHHVQDPVMDYVNPKQMPQNDGISAMEHLKKLSPQGPKAPAKTDNAKQVDLCTTPQCVISAANFLQGMDMTADPCDDFYQFTCGGWIESHEIPATSGTISQFNQLRVNLNKRVQEIISEEALPDDIPIITATKTMYSTCMDTVTWSIIYLDQASLGLPGRDIYLDPGLSVIVDAYETLIIETAKAMRDALGSDVTDTLIQAEAAAVIQFETLLAEITTPDSDRLNYSAMYNKMPLPELQASTDAIVAGKFNWKQYLDDLASGTDVVIDANEEIVVYEPEFMEKLTALVDATDRRTLANYLSWRLVFDFGDQTNQQMTDIFFEFQKVIAGVTAPLERSLVCASITNSLMGMAISRRYVERYFAPEAKEEVEVLISDLKTAFGDILTNLDWMDEETRVRAEAKLGTIRSFVAYPDFILDDNALSDYYQGVVSVTEGEHFLNMYLSSGGYFASMMKTLYKPTDRDTWITDPTIVNAFYYPSMNSITFPAGILQSPFFESGTLAALNYGGIGMVIGHEITHGFDNSGRQFDEFGNVVEWWTPETNAAYEEKANCFIQQYDNFTVPELEDILGENSHVNGLLTLGENIADNGGIREAYMAYQAYVERNGPEPYLPGLEAYSPNQLLFWNFAYNWCSAFTDEYLLNLILNDVHSPAKFRVWGPVSNSPEFANAWGCQPSDNMNNGEERCIIW
ncbi:unnamed protein product [Cyprideis torosa]|uniref:Uncharacterized protein n=1 Tax=Cyprideis torosa TaxID=163714 RepID=A0A7R8ZKB7_9CRUS|nr:unnamed protein product [Cyprideis torosa]CAG0879907.1 unnamed protein product [Cyprideis torosa]